MKNAYVSLTLFSVYNIFNHNLVSWVLSPVAVFRWNNPPPRSVNYSPVSVRIEVVGMASMGRSCKGANGLYKSTRLAVPNYTWKLPPTTFCFLTSVICGWNLTGFPLKNYNRLKTVCSRDEQKQLIFHSKELLLHLCNYLNNFPLLSPFFYWALDSRLNNQPLLGKGAFAFPSRNED